MPVHGLDHYNLRAPPELMEALRSFYREVVGLREGDRPPFKRFGYWLYAADRPVLHLAVAYEDDVCEADVPGTFNHASFNCTNRAKFEQILKQHGVAYRLDHISLTGQVQLFFADPAGNGVELIFADENA